MKHKISLYGVVLLLFIITLLSVVNKSENQGDKSFVDYVNPYMGSISHLLVPAYPTIHLPNSMLRVYPERVDYTGDVIKGLPIIMTSHRGTSAFKLSPISDPDEKVDFNKIYSYDLEKVSPYRYSVYLDEELVHVDFAPSNQSAVYHFDFCDSDENKIIISTEDGFLHVDRNTIKGYQNMNDSKTRVYIYMEFDRVPSKAGIIESGRINQKRPLAEGRDIAIGLNFEAKSIGIRYGVSFISAEQAEKNLGREIKSFNVNRVADEGKEKWNDALGKIEIEGGNENDKVVFYTSLYRTYERMINISEDGKYYSGIDNQIHEDNGIPFFTDDWIWDTYRATHPLRVLIDEESERQMINSYIRMAKQTKEGWMPTFPEVTGDSHRMNSNHAVAVIWDAYSKGIRGFNLRDAFNACKGAITEKSLLPWKRIPNTELDEFFQKEGYFPALDHGQKEYIKEVVPGEKRQPVAVTLGTSYDYWCLAHIANELNMLEEYELYMKRSYNYRNIYNEQTGFFHPKNNKGEFIEPFDYRFSGGQGARDFYGENNGWIYRWDVQHNIQDLIQLMGGKKKFTENLDDMFREPLGKSKFEFFSQLPDHTGNVGQFSMSNEPALHIPYLYNYADQPWKTQKRIRNLLRQWFRNDLMGIPGDEDGGGMSAFVVFSAMGFYPVTPGLPVYEIGSPLFPKIKLKLSNGKVFEVIVENFSEDNKYIQSASLNGMSWNKTTFNHSDISNGGKLLLRMDNKPNRDWGVVK